MDSIILAADFNVVVPPFGVISTVHGRSALPYCSSASFPAAAVTSSSDRRRRRNQFTEFRRPEFLPFASTDTANSVPTRDGLYTVGDFMTRKEHLHVVKPSTTVDEALETLVDKRVTGFPVIDDDWKLVGVVSDYDLLALDSISGGGPQDTNMFPDVDSTWKSFTEIQKLLSKTNGKVVGDLMTPAPLVVRESTNLEDAVRILLKTKYRRLPVLDGEGKLAGLITRGDVVRAALRIKQATDKM